MTTAYWAQYSHTELLSIHGLEIDEEDLYEDEDKEMEEEHCCGNCMECLGMSWSDFM